MKKIKDKVLEVEPNIREELRSILNYIKRTLEAEGNVDGFSDRFEKIHPDFYKHILSISPTLTSHELRHLALVKLGMTSAEIAKTLSIKKESLRVLRYRLKKKLGGIENLAAFTAQF